MSQTPKLTLECLAIGSLPQDNLDSAMNIVKKDFHTIPFWPQLAKVDVNEDMIIQFLENLPSFFLSKNYFDTENENYHKEINQFFCDYDEIISSMNTDKTFKIIDKYKISNKCSKSFSEFVELIKKTNAYCAKGQITGPFTLSTNLFDKSGKLAIFNNDLKEVIVKTLALKALWQIKEIKNAGAIPIIFIDEPSISRLEASEYIGISTNDIVSMIKEISDLIKINGGLSGVHCCGICDWSIPISAGVNIISFDAYSHMEHLSSFSNYLKPFLENGNKIAWGIIPTLNVQALEKANITEMVDIFDKAVKYLTNKGIDEKIIIENSLITPTCGAGGLSAELAEKAMNLTSDLSKILKERYSI